MIDTPASRNWTWKWTVCVMLLFATMLNYMDRMTLNQLSPRIMGEFALNNAEYGRVESAFAIAFALGALLGGLMVDRWNVWWVYPSAVFAWSLAGAATGLANDYATLLGCRFCLGLAEAVHWPCALRTTQRILAKDQRTLGNSILQSGAAVGAVLTPLVILGLLNWFDDWRPSFMAIGGLGIFWVAAWLLVVRPQDLALPVAPPSAPLPPFPARPAEGETGVVSERMLLRGLRRGLPSIGRVPESLLSVFRDRRFWLLIVVVLSINCTWHYFRVWLPKFLQENHGYTESDVQYFSAAYYLMTDFGSLAAGFATLGLARAGLRVHTGRMIVFSFCAALTSLSLYVSQLSSGLLLLAILLIIGFGALGLFPNYYSFTQDLTVKHQGKITGMLGCINWLGMAALHAWVGRNLDETRSYAIGLTIAGVMPLLAAAAMFQFWRDKDKDGK